MKKTILLTILFFIVFIPVDSQNRIIPGAERMDVYVPFLKGKSVAVFANQTSMVHHTNLVDTLLKRGIKVVKIFGPEHGFRGEADAGEKVGNAIDKATGVKVISLYGKHNKPTAEDLQDVDVMIFDIQDVGTRFYTFISSLQYYIEAALENSKPLLILDRPNPNGFYVDGPVLDPKFKSFIGMQPIPIVYGMTIGEYAFMIAGENWLSDAANKKYAYYLHAKSSVDTPFHFLVIKCLNYNHNSKYILPVKPSPNLPSIQSVYCYPSTCLFEGTSLSEGRGTSKP
ncbi:MAG: exo-beta-N-acetylmuramidase NamZ family protein, partial [Ginsengibacter sp.]